MRPPRERDRVDTARAAAAFAGFIAGTISRAELELELDLLLVETRRAIERRRDELRDAEAERSW